MIQDNLTQQIEHDELKYAENLLIYRFSRLDWEVFDLDLSNNKEAS